ncbi:hypothetical protein VJ923_01335 [Adlercreutzia sp. R25]|uniref:Uncharacterized protein n=1 Tax=Adlercreutzia shanghongiae TaxID=3111773 RepID=A0ABU6IYM6_9ACTN|nr:MULTISPECIES: hypothetical protein [unclassified Adlercreutzia]MEC4271801.1 hypothetical protein [Adlercreutzia sp. R25]MEC4294808.1 hypothetical protein [Adlercreutzia sp. R22]
MEDGCFKLPPLTHLGWAFLLAWVFCVFYTSAAGGISAGLSDSTGSLATGIGSALMWVMWGEYYAVIPRDKAEGLAAASMVRATPWQALDARASAF